MSYNQFIITNLHEADKVVGVVVIESSGNKATQNQHPLRPARIRQAHLLPAGEKQAAVHPLPQRGRARDAGLCLRGGTRALHQPSLGTGSVEQFSARAVAALSARLV